MSQRTNRLHNDVGCKRQAGQFQALQLPYTIVEIYVWYLLLISGSASVIFWVATRFSAKISAEEPVVSMRVSHEPTPQVVQASNEQDRAPSNPAEDAVKELNAAIRQARKERSNLRALAKAQGRQLTAEESVQSKQLYTIMNKMKTRVRELERLGDETALRKND